MLPLCICYYPRLDAILVWTNATISMGLRPPPDVQALEKTVDTSIPEVRGVLVHAARRSCFRHSSHFLPSSLFSDLDGHPDNPSSSCSWSTHRRRRSEDCHRRCVADIGHSWTEDSHKVRCHLICLHMVQESRFYGAKVEGPAHLSCAVVEAIKNSSSPHLFAFSIKTNQDFFLFSMQRS